jgi:hypothetical protein
VCNDPKTLRTYNSTGTCSAGLCDYAGQTETCSSLCLLGRCIDSCILRVDAASTAGASADGQTWDQAFDDLAVAAELASLAATSDVPCQIWVATGLYRSFAVDADDTFEIGPFVELYGGFEGDELSLSDRPVLVVPASTVLDGASEDGGAHVRHVVTAKDDTIIDGFSIRGGRALGAGAASHGGGLLYVPELVGSTLTLRNLAFTDNLALSGGAIAQLGAADLILEHCRFGAGNGARRGGAVYAEGALDMADCEIKDAVFSGTAAEVDEGGAAIFTVGSLVLSETLLQSNDAGQGAGGAIFAFGAGVTLENAVFIDNSARRGGALHLADGAVLEVVHSTFRDNRAEYFDSGTGTWLDGQGGAVHALGSATTRATGSIFWESEPTHFETSVAPVVEWSDVQGGFAGTGNINADPRFVAAGSGQIQFGSPCIDAANGDIAPATDILGRPRWDDLTTDNSGTGEVPYADMGAYEVRCDVGQYPWQGGCYAGRCRAYVASDGEPRPELGDSWAHAYFSVQRGVASAAAGRESAGGRCEVWVKEGEYRIFTSLALRATDSVRLAGGVDVYGGFRGTEASVTSRSWFDSFAEFRQFAVNGLGTLGAAYAPTVLSGANPREPTEHVDHIVRGAPGARLDGFVVRDGGSNESAASRFVGGGVYHVARTGSQSFTVANCLVAYNQGSGGGGLYADAAAPVRVENTLFGYNSSVQCGGGMMVRSPAVLEGVFFAANGSYSESGAGMCVVGTSADIERCAFISNAAENNGGAIYAQFAQVEVRSSVFALNSATSGGAVIEIGPSEVTILNSTFYGNSANEGADLWCFGQGPVVVASSILWAQEAGSAVGGNTGLLSVRRSDIAGGYGLPTDKNKNVDPRLVDVPRLDCNPFGCTLLADAHLGASSPCIDEAEGDLSPALDFDKQPRYDNTSIPNGGSGTPPFADMGAFERQSD